MAARSKYQCKTGKRQFRDDIAAKLALAKLQNNSTRLSVPQRAYKCPMCHKWHLTSQDNKYENMKEQQ